jgi:ParB family chromosome partitioning protein
MGKVKQAIEGASRLNAFSVDPESLTIITDEQHPLYDERVKLPLDEKLVLNIAAHGVKQPVIITKDGDTLIVVDGRQRVRAATEANRRLAKEGKETIRIPVMLQRGDDADLFGMSIFLNEQRQNDSMLVKAKKAQRLINLGRTEEEVAVVFGTSSAAIRQWVKLFDLAPQVRAAVDAGEISASAAAKLAPLTKAEQVKHLADLRVDAAAGKKTTTKKVAAVAKKAKGEAVIEKPSTKLLKRLTAFGVDDPTCGLTDDDRNLLKWVLGEIDAKDAGLAEIIQSMEEAEINKEAAGEAAASAG